MPAIKRSFTEASGSYLSLRIEGDPASKIPKSKQFRDRLRLIMIDDETDTSEKVRSLLQLGVDRFDVRHGHLTKINPADGTHTIDKVSAQHPRFEAGSSRNLSHTFCRKIIGGADALVVRDALEDGWRDDRAYQEFDVDAYIGAKLLVDDDLYGTVCFVDDKPRDRAFTDDDVVCLEHLVRSIRKQLEKERQSKRLIRTAARLEVLFRGSPDMINVHDTEGNIVDVNPTLVERTGFSRDTLTDMKVWDLNEWVTPDAAKIFWASMKTGEKRTFEGRYRCQDGSTFPVEVNVRRLDLDQEDRFLATTRDITDRKKREERLKTTMEKAEQAARLKTAMLANMSHEIRTPLTSIMGFSEILSEELTGANRELTTRIYRSGQRLMKTLESVIELSKLESESYEFRRERLDFREVVTETLELLDQQASRESVTVRREVSDSPVEGNWHEGALNRIVENLVGNAIKFTPEGGTVSVRVSDDPDVAVLQVEDTGIGMSEEYLPDLFDAFKQESQGLDREYEGSGLGLSIVKRLVDLHDGSITVETEKGSGTSFTVRLPKCEPN